MRNELRAIGELWETVKRARLGKSLRLYRLAVFLLNTGARRGEALALEWRDVDFSRSLITLWATKSAHGGGKAKSRHIPMNAALREVLAAMQKENPGAGKVFPRPANLRREFTRACQWAGIGHCRVHDIRHTFASHLVLGGAPLNTVRELLGHSTMTMSLKYAQLQSGGNGKGGGSPELRGAERGRKGGSDGSPGRVETGREKGRISHSVHTVEKMERGRLTT